MKTKTYSQIGQDLFALLCHPEPAVFLDIGCNSPDFQSNSRLLLELGWKGAGIDMDDHAAEWAAVSPSMLFVQADVTAPDFTLISMAEKPLEHLSVDVDEYSFVAILRLVQWGCRPQSITIEHDAYRFGDCLRGPQRKLLEKLGYVRVASDLHCFEDWWLDPRHPRFDEIAAKLKPIDGCVDAEKIKAHMLSLANVGAVTPGEKGKPLE